MELEKVQEQIKSILDNGITNVNLDNYYKLAKIRHFIKEEENMYRGYYGDYGYNYRVDYGRRGYDAKYRGYDHLERMGDHYGRYMDSHERYGASSEANDSLRNMLECMKSFMRAIKEEVKSPEEEQMLRQAIQELNV